MVHQPVGPKSLRSLPPLALVTDTVSRRELKASQRERICEGMVDAAVRQGYANVTVSRALLQEPSLLVIDEPTTGVDAVERDRILQLLRSLATEGVSILMALDKGIGLFAGDRALALSEGCVRGPVSTEVAEVVPLRLRQPLSRAAQRACLRRPYTLREALTCSVPTSASFLTPFEFG